MNKTQKIKKNKHGKIILIFITIILLVLFIGHLSRKEVKSEGYTGIEIIDINDRLGNFLLVSYAVEENILRKAVKDDIDKAIEILEGKTFLDIKDKISNAILVGWTLEYMYNQGYQINCVIGDWIILYKQ